MIKNIPVLYTGIYDYSTIFHHFVKRMVLAGCSFDQTTKFKHDYYSIFILPREKDVHSEIFISNYAKSIFLNDNKVTGLLLDTTWYVMSNYVAYILMASIGNSGIHLSFAFGPRVTKSLYYRVIIN